MQAMLRREENINELCEKARNAVIAQCWEGGKHLDSEVTRSLPTVVRLETGLDVQGELFFTAIVSEQGKIIESLCCCSFLIRILTTGFAPALQFVKFSLLLFALSSLKLLLPHKVVLLYDA